MSYEPRMRGARSRRQATKKRTPKGKKEEHESSYFYEEQTPVEPSEVKTKTLNALEHLGNQRFALPPFIEHFDRWIQDVEAVLIDFEADLPSAIDPPYKQSTQNALLSVQEFLRNQVAAERENSTELSKRMKELTSCELELANLEREYRTRTQQYRKKHQQSLDKYKEEIDSLDKRRLALLRRRPSFIDRIFGRSDSRLEESTGELHSRKTDLGREEDAFKKDLEELRNSYEAKRSALTERREELKTNVVEFEGNGQNDAVEARSSACRQLGQAVDEAVLRLAGRQPGTNKENIQ